MPITDPIITLKDVRLSLDGNAGAVDILKGISRDVARGDTLGLTERLSRRFRSFRLMDCS